MIILLVLALVIFGPKRLPEIGRSLGKGLREFKDTVGGESSSNELTSANTAPGTQAATDAETANSAERS